MGVRSNPSSLKSFFFLAALSLPAAAASFPPLSEAEKSLTSVSGHPEAAAVVLFKKGEVWLTDPLEQAVPSRFRVETRIKILSEEGKKTYGELLIPHSRFHRLSKIEGRTVAPDGKATPLPEDAVFLRRASKTQKLYVTALAFPAVEIGSIIDYRYEIKFNSFLILEPWHFQEEIPVASSEIVYHVPLNMGFRPWGTSAAGQKMEQDVQRKGTERTIRFKMEGLIPIPDEPFGVPATDLASKIMLVPTVFKPGGGFPDFFYLQSWETVCKLIDQSYRGALRKDRKARKQVPVILTKAGSGASEQEKARALYRFVRDEIETLDLPGIFVDTEDSADAVLSAGRGNYAGKAILLKSLLSGAKIQARLVWAPSRLDGAVDPTLPNPSWFERVLVRVEIGGKAIFLDPCDRRLGFGRLLPSNEGMPAVIYDPKKPEVITLPESPFEASSRRAFLDLEIEPEGLLAGRGKVTFSGHSALRHLSGDGSAAEAAEDLEEWIGDRFKGFEIAQVEVGESVSEGTVEVRWSMEQHLDEALGDEVSLQPSRPLGPLRQLFNLPPESRRTPVLFSYADRDEVEVKIRWPEGWELDVVPSEAAHQGSVGELATAVTVDGDARTLSYTRRFDLVKRFFATTDEYAALRNLFAAAERHDAQSLVFIRP